MRFIQRLGYYLGGFAIGLVILAFFLSGKNASCDYGPNARTVKNITSKPLKYKGQAEEFMDNNRLDSSTVLNLIKYGNVDFSKSNTKLDTCKIYVITNTYKESEMLLQVENCDSIANLISIEYVKPE